MILPEFFLALVLSFATPAKSDRLDYATRWLMLSARTPATFVQRYGEWQNAPAQDYWASINAVR